MVFSPVLTTTHCFRFRSGIPMPRRRSAESEGAVVQERRPLAPARLHRRQRETRDARHTGQSSARSSVNVDVAVTPYFLFQMSHMGTYVCTAVEYVGRPGSRVSVYLRVIEGTFRFGHLAIMSRNCTKTRLDNGVRRPSSSA